MLSLIQFSTAPKRNLIAVVSSVMSFCPLTFAESQGEDSSILPIAQINELYEQHLVWLLREGDLSVMEQERTCKKGLQNFPASENLLDALYPLFFNHHEVALAAAVCEAALDYGESVKWQERQLRSLKQITPRLEQPLRPGQLSIWKVLKDIQKVRQNEPGELVEYELRTRKFIKENIIYFDALMHLGSVYVLQGDRFMTRGIFALAHRLDPRDYDAAINYSLALLQEGMPERADAVVAPYLHNVGVPPYFLLVAAQVAKIGEQPEKAMLIKDRVIHSSMASPELLYQIFEDELNSGDFDFSERVAEVAKQRFGETPSVCLMMARLNREQHSQEQVERWLEKLKSQLNEENYLTIIKAEHFKEENPDE